MARFTDGAGYLLVDDRNSGGNLSEDDLIACAHCPRFVKKKEWNSNGAPKAWCCDKPLCEACTRAPLQLTCPGNQEAQIEKALSELHRREQNAKILGI